MIVFYKKRQGIVVNFVKTKFVIDSKFIFLFGYWLGIFKFNMLKQWVSPWILYDLYAIN